MISIHAPARGATRESGSYVAGDWQFQSTLPRGERLFPSQHFLRCRSISIHAPARGATTSTQLADATTLLFQSTLPRGERLLSAHYLRRPPEFQSTLPRGERRYSWSRLYPFNPNFNPRSREGSDDAARSPVLCTTYISIHAPARGATLFPVILFSIRLFQSTLPRGERPRTTSPIPLMILISIHAPARGATRPKFITFFFGNHFNPRSREGSDVAPAAAAVTFPLFQSTLPRGERPSGEISAN